MNLRCTNAGKACFFCYSPQVLIKNLIISTYLFAASVSLSHAADHPCAIGTVYSGIVAANARAEKFWLEGQTVKFGLAGIYVPRKFVPSGKLTLYVAQPKPERYGRVLVQAFEGGDWLQGQLLKNGKAAVFGLGQLPACLEAMRGMERPARLKHKGVWAKSGLLLKSDQLDELGQKTGHFLVVEGQVLSIGDRIKRVYLNFGQNWSQDFTVSVVKKGRGAFKGELSTLFGLKNRRVQVRGILEQQKGPLMRVIDEAQIEIID